TDDGPPSENRQTPVGTASPPATAGRRQLLDTTTVSFGPPRKVRATPARSRKDGKVKRPHAPKSKAPEMVAPGSTPTPDKDAERRAVEIVTRYGYEVSGAVEVRDVQLMNKGWDLEFHFADESWEPVEVKGNLGNAPFVIT